MSNKIVWKHNEEKSTKYHIPEDIKKKIPKYFYQAFFGELVSVFGYQCLVPLFEYGSYREQIEDFLTNDGGTGGWYEAFWQTCMKLDLEWLMDYYKSLSWYDSGLFDSEIADGIVIHFINDKQTNCNSYYTYLCQNNKQRPVIRE